MSTFWHSTTLKAKQILFFPKRKLAHRNIYLSLKQCTKKREEQRGCCKDGEALDLCIAKRTVQRWRCNRMEALAVSACKDGEALDFRMAEQTGQRWRGTKLCIAEQTGQRWRGTKLCIAERTVQRRRETKLTYSWTHSAKTARRAFRLVRSLFIALLQVLNHATWHLAVPWAVCETEIVWTLPK